jgi:hypothetical protein
MTDKLWKSWERKIAKYIGGERIPVSGRQRGYAPDIKHAWLAVEIKQRKKLPEWIADAMRQAEASAIGVQLPVVILAEKGQETGETYILCRLSQFRDRWIA